MSVFTTACLVAYSIPYGFCKAVADKSSRSWVWEKGKLYVSLRKVCIPWGSFGDDIHEDRDGAVNDGPAANRALGQEDMRVRARRTAAGQRVRSG